MDFGFTLKPEHSIERIIALTRQAEAAGFGEELVVDVEGSFHMYQYGLYIHTSQTFPPRRIPDTRGPLAPLPAPSLN